MPALSGKVVVVTGGFGALGSSVVRLALAQEAKVAALGHSAKPSSGSALNLGDIDLADEKACARAMAEVEQALGPIHGLVNVAGGFEMASLTEGGLEPWDRMYRTNLRTALAATYAALPLMTARKSGRIVNIGATAAAKGAAAMGAYAAAKSGIARLTESLADEMRGKGVTVNAVLPTIIDTPANRAAMPQADHRKWTPPDDIAEVILFLLSDKARAVNGALINVPGAP